MATLRSLNINIRAGVAHLAADFQKANSLVGKFQHQASNEFRKLTGSIFNVKTAIIGLIGSAGLGALIKGSFASADALAKSADKLGLTTEAMAGLTHASDLAGVNTQKLNIGLVTMQKNLGDATQGSGTAIAALGALGVKVKDIIQLSPDKQFGVLADALNRVQNATLRADYAYRIFGQSGVDLLNVTKDGSKGLKDATDEAVKLGIALSRVDAAKIEMANDAFTRTGDAIKGVANTIAITLAPYLKYTADWFTELVKRNNGFRNAVLTGFTTVIKIMGFFGDSVRYGVIGFYALKTAALTVASAIANTYKALNDAITQLVNNLINKIRGPVVSMLEKLGKYLNAAKDLAQSLNELKIEPDKGVIDWANTLEQQLMDTRGQLSKFTQAPLPSDKFKNFLKGISDNAKITANDIALQSGKMATNVTASVEVVSKKGKDLFSQLTQAGNNWADTFTNTIVDFVKTGKLSFKSFADAVITDLIRIATYRAITMPLFGAAGIPGFANGGIMTSKGPIQLNHYANGGIASSPQMAIFGEGSRPEAYVPLPDGRSIPVKISNQQQTTTTVQHNYTINAIDAPSFQKLVVSNPEAVAVAVQTIYNRKARSGGPYR